MWFFSCCLLQSLQGRQRLLEIRTISRWHGIKTLLVGMKPPFVLVVEVFLFGQMVSVIFICESIPSSTNFFISMMLNHSNTEFMISYESVMDSLELFLFAFLLQLVSRKIFFVSWLFTKSMPMKSSLLDDIFR